MVPVYSSSIGPGQILCDKQAPPQIRGIYASSELTGYSCNYCIPTIDPDWPFLQALVRRSVGLGSFSSTSPCTMRFSGANYNFFNNCTLPARRKIYSWSWMGPMRGELRRRGPG